MASSSSLPPPPITFSCGEITSMAAACAAKKTAENYNTMWISTEMIQIHIRNPHWTTMTTTHGGGGDDGGGGGCGLRVLRSAGCRSSPDAATSEDAYPRKEKAKPQKQKKRQAPPSQLPSSPRKRKRPTLKLAGTPSPLPVPTTTTGQGDDDDADDQEPEEAPPPLPPPPESSIRIPWGYQLPYAMMIAQALYRLRYSVWKRAYDDDTGSGVKDMFLGPHCIIVPFFIPPVGNSTNITIAAHTFDSLKLPCSSIGFWQLLVKFIPNKTDKDDAQTLARGLFTSDEDHYLNQEWCHQKHGAAARTVAAAQQKVDKEDYFRVLVKDELISLRLIIAPHVLLERLPPPPMRGTPSSTTTTTTTTTNAEEDGEEEGISVTVSKLPAGRDTSRLVNKDDLVYAHERAIVVPLLRAFEGVLRLVPLLDWDSSSSSSSSLLSSENGGGGRRLVIAKYKNAGRENEQTEEQEAERECYPSEGEEPGGGGGGLLTHLYIYVKWSPLPQLRHALMDWPASSSTALQAFEERVYTGNLLPLAMLFHLVHSDKEIPYDIDDPDMPTWWKIAVERVDKYSRQSQSHHHHHRQHFVRLLTLVPESRCLLYAINVDAAAAAATVVRRRQPPPAGMMMMSRRPRMMMMCRGYVTTPMKIATNTKGSKPYSTGLLFSNRAEYGNILNATVMRMAKTYTRFLRQQVEEAIIPAAAADDRLLTVRSLSAYLNSSAAVAAAAAEQQQQQQQQQPRRSAANQRQQQFLDSLPNVCRPVVFAIVPISYENINALGCAPVTQRDAQVSRLASVHTAHAAQLILRIAELRTRGRRYRWRYPMGNTESELAYVPKGAACMLPIDEANAVDDEDDEKEDNDDSAGSHIVLDATFFDPASGNVYRQHEENDVVLALAGSLHDVAARFMDKVVFRRIDWISDPDDKWRLLCYPPPREVAPTILRSRGIQTWTGDAAMCTHFCLWFVRRLQEHYINVLETAMTTKTSPAAAAAAAAVSPPPPLWQRIVDMDTAIQQTAKSIMCKLYNEFTDDEHHHHHQQHQVRSATIASSLRRVGRHLLPSFVLHEYAFMTDTVHPTAVAEDMLQPFTVGEDSTVVTIESTSDDGGGGVGGGGGGDTSTSDWFYTHID